MEFNQLDALYSSTEVKKLEVFYESVGDIARLIEFSRLRPSPPVSLLEFNSDQASDVVVVVPTADSRAPPFLDFLRSAGGFRIVAAESRGDHFNFARAMNVGIREALRHEPDWIILANDDIILRCSAPALRCALADINEEVAVPQVSNLRGRPIPQIFNIYKQRAMFRLAVALLSHLGERALPVSNRAHSAIARLPAGLRDGSLPYFLFGLPSPQGTSVLRPPHELPIGGRMLQIAGESIGRVINIQPIAAIASRRLRVAQFDEIFLNGGEDIDLALKLQLAGAKSRVINCKATTTSGTSLGHSELRLWKNTIFENLYMAHKLGTDYRDWLLGTSAPARPVRAG